MLTFVEAKIIVMVRKGLRWKKGHRPQATQWRYLLLHSSDSNQFST